MWKRHPLIRFAIAIALAVLIVVAVLAMGLLDSRLWADAKAAPLQIQGVITKITPPSSVDDNQLGFDVSDGSQIVHFEASPYLVARLDSNEKVKIDYSPNLHHIYWLQALTADGKNGQFYGLDDFNPNLPFQTFQIVPFLTLLIAFAIAAIALGYGIASLLDWLMKPRLTKGTVLVRVEQADFNAGFAMLVRPFDDKKRSYRFVLTQEDFLKADSSEFVEVQHTPIFRFVRAVRPLALDEVPSLEMETERSRLPNEAALLHSLSRWQYLRFVYTDLIATLALFGFPLIVVISCWSTWFEPVGRYGELYQRVLLPMLALMSLIVGCFVAFNFIRKWRDVRLPARLTEGPVLSKWRVNGVSNENRRQIVVADGGLEAGGAAVRKFDIPVNIFDELQVGDIVKIAHTPNLRYILRLEVTGHQELVRKV